LIRDQGKTVGVLCVDPTSPFSGGAILGDRVRMQRHSTDEGVFIRSMATRGQFGGLTQATRGAVMVLDAMGKDCIIVETVGVGQDEVDIARTADTTLIVLVPGMGDDIQAIKAGILEIGDIFVINKADREGVERSIQDIRAMIELGKCTSLEEKEWTPPILKTVANQDQGIDELWKKIERHRDFLTQNHSEYYRRRIHLKHKLELVELVKQRVVDSVLKKMEATGALDQYVEDLIARKADPYTLSEQILAKFYE
ncbi:MAG: methylmalonyl Co-A mutase-associated GTPase MeaB, partial [Thermodesulfobacteriota bacterium]|nr:methylmalonyl Co-A mutase-associated GTPase MeaB [Thermodesulfobacteriota bacterium]